MTIVFKKENVKNDVKLKLQEKHVDKVIAWTMNYF